MIYAIYLPCNADLNIPIYLIMLLILQCKLILNFHTAWFHVISCSILTYKNVNSYLREKYQEASHWMRQVLHSNAMFIDGVSLMVSLSVFNNQLSYHLCCHFNRPLNLDMKCYKFLEIWMSNYGIVIIRLLTDFWTMKNYLHKNLWKVYQWT